ncbi:NAD(P)-binding protein [Jackrogersella minutella]|nr:NAD(P)-binding protein [Jackrogersella minutella]
MVKLSTVRAANAAFAEKTTKPFVAVVAGGTAGIGEAAVRELAATFAGRGGPGGSAVHVHIVGRNQQAADKIIEDCSAVCPGGVFQFHKGDLSLLREVDRVCAGITQFEQQDAEKRDAQATVDFLVECQGVLSLTVEDNEEGLDKYDTLYYYSRMRFVDRLLPLLTASPDCGHVVSVLNAGVQASVVFDDLALKNPRNQGMQTRFAHWIGLTNIFMEELARRNSGRLSMIHWHPGYVSTGIASASNFPWYLKVLLTYIVNPLCWCLWIPYEEVGQRILFMASPTTFPARESKSIDATTRNVKGSETAVGIDGEIGSGAYLVDKKDGSLGKEKKYDELRANGSADKIYQHTMAVFAEIEAGRAFKG